MDATPEVVAKVYANTDTALWQLDPVTKVAERIGVITGLATDEDMTDIAVNARLVVDVGDAAEIVVVRSLGVLSFTAVFAADHAASCPVAVMSGEARLRLLLHRADSTWQSMQSSDVGDVAGLKRIEGDVEWFPGGNTLKERTAAYEAIVGELSFLCRVESLRGRRRSGQLEAY